jgi:hypothetical protein
MVKNLETFNIVQMTLLTMAVRLYIKWYTMHSVLIDTWYEDDCRFYSSLKNKCGIQKLNGWHIF